MLDSNNSVFEGAVNKLLRNELISTEQSWIEKSTVLSYWVMGDKDGKKLDRLVTIGNGILKEKSTDDAVKRVMAKNLGVAMDARATKREGHALTKGDTHAKELMDKLSSSPAGLPTCKPIHADLLTECLEEDHFDDLRYVKLDIDDSKSFA
jgi:hypothetical protein